MMSGGKKIQTTCALVLLLVGAMVGRGLIYDALALCPPAPVNCTQCQGACDPDVNNDGKVTVADLFLVLVCFRQGCVNPAYDLNGDGFVNMLDFNIVRRCYGCDYTPSPGA